MKYIFLLLFISLHADFTAFNDPKIVAFEKELAFYYDVEDPEPLRSNYIAAIRLLEQYGIDYPELKTYMIIHLEFAYLSLANQRGWDFDVKKAAALEYDIIIGSTLGLDISEKQIELYQMIYHSNDFAIEKAVMLRSFIYHYKVKVLQEERTLSQEEMELLLNLARLSENYLRSLEPH